MRQGTPNTYKGTVCGNGIKLCHKRCSRCAWLHPCFLTCSGPCACRPASRLAGAQRGQQRAAHDAAHEFATLPALLHRIQIKSHTRPGQAARCAQQPCSLWRLQACTACVLMSSLASQARTAAVQHQMQLAVKALRELQALADVGDLGLDAAVQVGCVQ